MLLIAGMTGHSSAMGIFHIDFDVGHPTCERIDHASRPSGHTSHLEGITVIATPKTSDERKHPDKKGESQNLAKETGFYYHFVPLILPENAEDKFHHQVHTHDVPCWNCLPNSKDILPAVLCRLRHQQTRPEKGNFGTYLLPISTEKTAPH